MTIYAVTITPKASTPLEAQHLRVSGRRVSPGLRLMHEAFWCGHFHWPDRM
jgi:hypothetical protein